MSVLEQAMAKCHMHTHVVRKTLDTSFRHLEAMSRHARMMPGFILVKLHELRK